MVTFPNVLELVASVQVCVSGPDESEQATANGKTIETSRKTTGLRMYASTGTRLEPVRQPTGPTKVRRARRSCKLDGSASVTNRRSSTASSTKLSRRGRAAPDSVGARPARAAG